MEASGSGVATRQEASPKQQADRRLQELLQEVRVAQTGVQILFAFLLSMSFSERFDRLDATQRWLYLVALLACAVTTGFLVAPAAVHRVASRFGVPPETVVLGHRLFVVGLALLALTLAAAVLLVLDVVAGPRFAIPVTFVLGLFYVVLWFVVPWPLRHRGSGRS